MADKTVVVGVYDGGTKTFTHTTWDAGDTLKDADGNSIIKIAGTAAQGDVLYHNGTAWTRLPAGTAGYFLKTQGVGANPTWDVAGAGGSKQFAPTFVVGSADAGDTADDCTHLHENGVTDGLALAIVDLNTAGKGTLYIKRGTYETDSEFTITAVGRIIGAGEGATTITFTDDSPDTGSFSYIVMSGNDLSLEDMSIRFPPRGASTINNGIFASGVQNPKLVNVRVLDPSSGNYSFDNGILRFNSCTGVRLINYKFETTTTTTGSFGQFVGCSDVKLINSKMSWPSAGSYTAVLIDGGSNIDIVGCVMGANDNDYSALYLNGTISNLKIIGNNFKSKLSTQATGTLTLSNTIVSNNEIKNSNYFASLINIAAASSWSFTRCKYIGNILEFTGSAGAAGISANNFTYGEITNNTIKLTGGEYSDGVTVTNSSNYNKINGNNIIITTLGGTADYAKGVEVADSDFCEVSGNTMILSSATTTDPGPRQTRQTGILFDDCSFCKAHNNIIKTNFVLGAGIIAYTSVTDTDLSLSDNIIHHSGTPASAGDVVGVDVIALDDIQMNDNKIYCGHANMYGIYCDSVARTGIIDGLYFNGSGTAAYQTDGYTKGTNVPTI
jgi:hypothetical protein